LLWYNGVATPQNSFDLFNGIFDEPPSNTFIWYAIGRAAHLKELSPSLRRLIAAQW
jgi:hypothetical protein